VLTDEELASVILEESKKVASRYVAKGVRSVSHEDMRSAASVAMIERVKAGTYDAGAGTSLEGYLYAAGRNAVLRYLRDNCTAVRIPMRVRGEEFQRATRKAYSFEELTAQDEECRTVPTELHTTVTPEALLEDARWKRAVDEVVKDYLAPEGATGGAMALEVIHGAKSSAVAEKYGVEVMKVYRTTRNVRRRMEQSADLFALWQRL
jgi:hypothetical protein